MLTCMDKEPTTRITTKLPVKLARDAKHAAIDRGVDVCDLIAEGLRIVLAKKPRGQDADHNRS